MAGSLNRAMLIGNVTRDPELKKLPSGQSVTSFSVATNRTFTDSTGQKREQADFHNIVAWGRLAEICAQYLTKGKKVYVDGRIQNREWDGQDGQKKYRTEIVMENMVMLDRAGAPMATPGMPAEDRPSPAVSAPILADEPAPAADDEIKLEDIPF